MAVPVYIDNGGLVAVTGVSSVDLTFMGTINANDILIAQVIAGTDTDSWDAVSGWTKIGEDKFIGDLDLTFATYWRRATGSESGTETFTYGTTSDTLVGIMSRYSGCLTSGNPIEDPSFNNGITTTPDPNFYFNSLMTTGVDRLGIIAIGVGTDVQPDPPTSWTENFNISTTVGTDGTQSLFDLDIATAQTIAAGSGGLGRNNMYVNCIFALKPTVAGNDLIIGAVPITITNNGVLKGVGGLIGSSNFQFSLSGALVQIGAIIGSIAINFTSTGILKGAGRLIGGLNIAFTTLGTLKGKTALIASSLITFANQGILKGKGLFSGLINIIVTLTGSLFVEAESIELIEENSFMTISIEENSSITQSVEENSSITQSVEENSLI